MGNRCFKKKYEPLLDLSYSELKQITIEKKGTCYICDKKDTIGYFVQSVVEDLSIFICKDCKKEIRWPNQQEAEEFCKK